MLYSASPHYCTDSGRMKSGKFLLLMTWWCSVELPDLPGGVFTKYNFLPQLLYLRIYVREHILCRMFAHKEGGVGGARRRYQGHGVRSSAEIYLYRPSVPSYSTGFQNLIFQPHENSFLFFNAVRTLAWRVPPPSESNEVLPDIVFATISLV